VTNRPGENRTLRYVCPDRAVPQQAHCASRPRTSREQGLRGVGDGQSLRSGRYEAAKRRSFRPPAYASAGDIPDIVRAPRRSTVVGVNPQAPAAPLPRDLERQHDQGGSYPRREPISARLPQHIGNMLC